MGLIIKRISAVIAFIVSFIGTAQSYHGFVDDNYNGVYGVVANPANVVDSRHRWNINIISYNGLMASDYETPAWNDHGLFEIDRLLSTERLFNDSFKSWLFNGPLVESGSVTEPNSTLANLDLLLPSFMTNINENHAIGFIWRMRAIYNYNNFDGRFWHGLTNGFQAAESFDFLTQDLDISTHYWSELGLSYGFVAPFDSRKHFLKAGATVKLLAGLGAEQILIDRRFDQTPIAGRYIAAEDPMNSSVELSGGFTYIRTFEQNTAARKISLLDRLSNATYTFGADVGFVYEYRTAASRRVAIGRNGGGFNKHDFRFSAALLDVGVIKYPREEVGSSNRAVQVVINPGTQINAQNLSEDFLAALINQQSENPTSVSVLERRGILEVALPTSVQVSAEKFLANDKQNTGKYYLNASVNQTVVSKDKAFNNNRVNLIAVTARYERKDFSFYLPVSFSDLGGLQFGLGARWKPFTLGSSSLFGAPTGNANQDMDQLYFGINVPGYQDRDQNFRRRGKYHGKRRKNHRNSRKRRR